MTEPIHIAVAIVGYRNCADISRCLDALQQSTHQDFEVVICENGGPDAFATLSAAVPQTLSGGQSIRVLQAPRNLGYAGGINACIRASADAEAWWVLNPDTEPHPEAMAAKLARLAVGDCDAVGCTLHSPGDKVESHGGYWQSSLARAVSIGHGDSLDSRPNVVAIEQRQNYLNGASIMIGRRFYEVVGPMREDYFLYCEEVEWCLRGVRRGMRLGFAPSAMVLHRQGTTTGRVADMSKRSRAAVYLFERNKILLTVDCFPKQLPLVAATTLGVLLTKYGRRGAWRQLCFGLRGWMGGLRDERGAPRWFEADS